MPRTKICSYCNKRVEYTATCECIKGIKRQRSKEKAERTHEMHKVLKSAKWKHFRLSIIKRDGEVCQRCLIKYNIVTKDWLEVHHIKPRIKYPELTFERINVVTLCKSCNTQLGIQEELDFPFTFEDEYVL
jgi:5-methylcytosine-specific restriction enzyme A